MQPGTVKPTHCNPILSTLNLALRKTHTMPKSPAAIYLKIHRRRDPCVFNAVALQRPENAKKLAIVSFFILQLAKSQKKKRDGAPVGGRATQTPWRLRAGRGPDSRRSLGRGSVKPLGSRVAGVTFGSRVAWVTFGSRVAWVTFGVKGAFGPFKFNRFGFGTMDLSWNLGFVLGPTLNTEP